MTQEEQRNYINTLSMMIDTLGMHLDDKPLGVTNKYKLESARRQLKAAKVNIRDIKAVG